MKKITKEVLHDAAERLMFKLTPAEVDTLYEEFVILTKQMELLGDIKDIDSYESMTFPFDCETSYLREDIPVTPLETEVALSNAKVTMDNQIKLPKVVI